MSTTTTAPLASRPGHPWLALVGFVLVSFAAGALGALTTSPDFYQELNRPAWSPPPAVFGPVWTTLYAMMGVAAWLVWRRPASPARRTALTLFAAQLGLNALWTPIFFGLQRLGLALVEILVLEVFVIATTVAFFRLSRGAGALLLPYAAWVGFAAFLNYTLWTMN